MKETVIDIATHNLYTPWKFTKIYFGTLYEWADPAQTMVNFEQNKWEVMQHPSTIYKIYYRDPSFYHAYWLLPLLNG